MISLQQGPPNILNKGHVHNLSGCLGARLRQIIVKQCLNIGSQWEFKICPYVGAQWKEKIPIHQWSVWVKNAPTFVVSESKKMHLSCWSVGVKNYPMSVVSRSNNVLLHWCSLGEMKSSKCGRNGASSPVSLGSVVVSNAPQSLVSVGVVKPIPYWNPCRLE